MKLIDEWKVVLRKAWSMRLILSSAAVSAVATYLQTTDPLSARTLIATGVAGVLAAAAAAARVVDQPKLQEAVAQAKEDHA